VNDASIDLEDLVWHLDEPLADLSALGFLALSKLASEHVTVALSGQGADELFGGYTQYRATALAATWNRFPPVVARPMLAAAVRGPARARRLARALTTTDPVERLLQGRGYLTADQRRTLGRGRLTALDGNAAAHVVRDRLAGLVSDPLSTSLYLDARLGLVDDMLHYFDRASMAHSLEVRVPFLDHELVELAARIPPRLKVHRLTTKVLLRHVARGLVPETVIDKPKVGFFNAAVDAWFRAQSRGAISDYLLTRQPRYAEFLDPTGVEHLVRSHASGAAHGGPLLAILMLEVWLSSFLPRAVRNGDTARERVRLTA
jgi:asparagine synthase (glutamine-hydrolysing)